MNRLILAEPGLASYTGHQQAHARALAAECRHRGFAFLALASANADDAVLTNFPARKAFRIGVFDRPGSGGWLAPIVHWRIWSRRYQQDFTVALQDLDPAEDLLVLNTVKVPVLEGFSRWLTAQRADGPATVVVLRLPVEEGLPRGRLPQASRWLYRRVLNRLREQLGQRLLLAADAQLIAEDFERLIQRPVAAIPLPIDVPPPVPLHKYPASVHLVFPSPARRRGFELVPSALETAFARHPELTAAVRLPVKPRDRDREVIAQLETMAPRVRLVRDALPNAEFYSLLSGADVVLLSYDPVVFAKRSSQILIECAALGRPVIVTAGSFLDAECRAAGIVAVTAEAFTSEALADAIGHFIADRERLAAAAWSACPKHRGRHSVTAFMDRLVEFTASCETARTATASQTAADGCGATAVQQKLCLPTPAPAPPASPRRGSAWR